MVQPKISNNWLQLVFHVGGKPRYLSTGFIDMPTNCKLVEFKAREIEKDILCERIVLEVLDKLCSELA
ncbi:Arm DNA-binding domain-containing protein [Leptolyngbya sp. AN03gr2]|uniref:Arm DNA-binding domain-containing protein n=1 Tax=unclassified Leptolyngbya TaxID=2650499 RepID=UPI003D311465